MNDSGLAAPPPRPLPAPPSLPLLQMCLDSDSDTARPVPLCALHPNPSGYAPAALRPLLHCSFAEENIFEIVQEITNQFHSLDEKFV